MRRRQFNAGYADLADAPVSDSRPRCARRPTTPTCSRRGSRRTSAATSTRQRSSRPRPRAATSRRSTRSRSTTSTRPQRSTTPVTGRCGARRTRRFHPYFRTVADELGLDDVLLLDRDGDIVYTTYKGTDLGSNIIRGELSGGALEQVFQEALQSNNRDFVAGADFVEYQPSYARPTMFIASPVGTASDLSGVLVYAVSTDKVNAVMTGGDDLSKVEGLGRTGETYLAGPDGTMRSISRKLIEDPDEFAELAARPRCAGRGRRAHGPHRQQRRCSCPQLGRCSLRDPGRVRDRPGDGLPRRGRPRLLCAAGPARPGVGDHRQDRRRRGPRAGRRLRAQPAPRDGRGDPADLRRLRADGPDLHLAAPAVARRTARGRRRRARDPGGRAVQRRVRGPGDGVQRPVGQPRGQTDPARGAAARERADPGLADASDGRRAVPRRRDRDLRGTPRHLGRLHRHRGVRRARARSHDGGVARASAVTVHAASRKPPAPRASNGCAA